MTVVEDTRAPNAEQLAAIDAPGLVFVSAWGRHRQDARCSSSVSSARSASGACRSTRCSRSPTRSGPDTRDLCSRLQHAEARVEPPPNGLRLRQRGAEAVDRRDPGAVESRARSCRPSSRAARGSGQRSSPAARSVYVITRTESTSRPASQTARTKRSTSTVVLPVPAPAETKTSPRASIAACCSGFGADRSCAPHPAHRPEVAPRGHVPPRGSWRRRRRGCARPPRARRRAPARPAPRTRPRRGSRSARSRARRPRARAQEPARLALARERPVEAAERLDADEVAQHEHVERDLEPLLRLDLPRRVRRLARLVVLHDPARAERVEVDAVDLAGEREAVAELEPALELGAERSRAERDLEAARHERQRRRGLGADEVPRGRARASARARGRWSSVSSRRTPLAIASSRHSRRNASASSSRLGVHALDAELLREAREELVQRLVRDRAAQPRVDLRVDRARDRGAGRRTRSTSSRRSARAR